MAKHDITPPARPEDRKPNQDAFNVWPQENMAMVCDGVGDEASAHPEFASGYARNELPRHLAEARKIKLSDEARAARWKEIVVEGSSVITPHAMTYAETLGRASEWQRAREQTLARAAQDFDPNQQPPAIVQKEALAIADAMETLSQEIYKTGTKSATTSVGLKVMEVDGQSYGIFWAVGDSDGFLEHDGSDGIRTVEKIVTSDSGLDIFDEAKEAMNPQVERFARFQLSGQGLGQSERVVTHIRVAKLEPGDRFLLASDGLIDNDPEQKFKETVRNRGGKSTHRDRLTQMTSHAISQHRGGGEGVKSSADDTTALEGEILFTAPEIELDAEDVEVVEEQGGLAAA